ncbi:MAG: DNA topoisomerase IB [Methylophilaceae bacterium]
MKSNKLRHINADCIGFTRHVVNGKFQYWDIDQQPLKSSDDLARITLLKIPPAWSQVWICSFPNGHIQATGKDAKGRKQYIYHKQWQTARGKEKYENMIEFGLSLPTIRQRVNLALAKPGLSREKVLATIIYLLEHTMIRIGNDAYAKKNKSFGLTTLRNRHVAIEGSEVKFHFRGKSGIEHELSLNDRRLAKIILKIKELPGQDLFQYLDEDGNRHAIGSSDVNEYLKEISGQDFTAKDFRTWAGTLHTLNALAPFSTETEAKKNLVQAIAIAAKKLGNTPAICKKSYVHPTIIETYLAGKILDILSTDKGDDKERLDQVEKYMLKLLRGKSL